MASLEQRMEHVQSLNVKILSRFPKIRGEIAETVQLATLSKELLLAEICAENRSQRDQSNQDAAIHEEAGTSAQ